MASTSGIISDKGKKVLGHEKDALGFAKAMLSAAKRYSEWVQATESKDDTGKHSAIARIGMVNKLKSRQHLLLLMALEEAFKPQDVEYLAAQVESYLFLHNGIGTQWKDHERTFLDWAQKIRAIKNRKGLEAFASGAMLDAAKKEHKDFASDFVRLTIRNLSPNYRISYVLGRLIALCKKAQQAEQTSKYYREFEVEHILPQTPRGPLPSEFADERTIKLLLLCLATRCSLKVLSTRP
ncbi:MAG: hypothetical protein IPH05_08805 [Flavobacteriales bacterium]|nr:hypothetical protein [Flavobacteriales bacterium]